MQGLETLQHGRNPKNTGKPREIQAETALNSSAATNRKISSTHEINLGTTNNAPFQTNPNKAYGHSIEQLPTENTLRIYHQNIRGAKTYQQWNTWKQGIQQLQKWKVGIATLAETNTKWNQVNINAANLNAQGTSTQVKINTACSSELTENDFQPGGTACVGLEKWTGRITSRINDESGQGRWSGFKIQGRQQKTLIILSAYRPTRSNDNSDRTCHSQQWRIMRSQNIENPNPRNQFIDDLTKQINKWKDENCEIIIGIDANEGLKEKNSKIAKLIATTNMEQLIDINDHPETFTRGSKPIDFILGTSAIKSAVTAGGYLPFYAGAWN
jgi:hypothetical protein